MRYSVLFCITAFALVANAQDGETKWNGPFSKMFGFTRERLDNVKEVIENMIRETTLRFQNALRVGKSNIDILVGSMNRTADSLTKRTSDAVINITKSLESNVKEYATSKGVDGFECASMKESLDEKAANAISSVDGCIAGKIRGALSSMNDVEVKYNQVMRQLTTYSDEAAQCTKKTGSFIHLVGAFKCILKTKVKTSWHVAKQTPRTLINLGRISFVTMTAPVTLNNCEPKESLENLKRYSLSLQTRIRRCIDEKSEKVRGKSNVDTVTERLSDAADATTARNKSRDENVSTRSGKPRTSGEV